VIAEYDVARVICRLDELADPGARSFTAGAGDWPLQGFVVRSGSSVYAYLNRCPHRGHALNWHPEEFLTPDERLIICASHGAVFEISSGACVGGPCRGIGLTSLDVIVERGHVLLTEDPQTLASAHA